VALITWSVQQIISCWLLLTLLAVTRQCNCGRCLCVNELLLQLEICHWMWFVVPRTASVRQTAPPSLRGHAHWRRDRRRVSRNRVRHHHDAQWSAAAATQRIPPVQTMPQVWRHWSAIISGWQLDTATRRQTGMSVTCWRVFTSYVASVVQPLQPHLHLLTDNLTFIKRKYGLNPILKTNFNY